MVIYPVHICTYAYNINELVSCSEQLTNLTILVHHFEYTNSSVMSLFGKDVKSLIHVQS